MLLVPRYPGTVAIRGAVRACRRVDVKGCCANHDACFHAVQDAFQVRLRAFLVGGEGQLLAQFGQHTFADRDVGRRCHLVKVRALKPFRAIL